MYSVTFGSGVGAEDGVLVHVAVENVADLLGSGDELLNLIGG